MKKVILCLFLMIISFTLSFAEKQDVMKFDGNDWRSWDYLRRLNFIAGFIAGSSYVVTENLYIVPREFDTNKAEELSNSYWEMDEEKKSFKKNFFLRSEVSILLENRDKDRNVQSYRYSIGGITNSQIVDGVNFLYEDFKNRAINLNDAIYVVKKQVEGTKPEDIERILLFLRGGKKDYFFKDAEGRFKFIEFP